MSVPVRIPAALAALLAALVVAVPAAEGAPRLSSVQIQATVPTEVIVGGPMSPTGSSCRPKPSDDGLPLRFTSSRDGRVFVWAVSSRVGLPDLMPQAWTIRRGANTIDLLPRYGFNLSGFAYPGLGATVSYRLYLLPVDRVGVPGRLALARFTMSC